MCDALYLLTQVVSKPIMRKISRMTNPHQIWGYLKTTYYRDSGFNFVGQISALFSLSEKLDMTIEAFLDQYEQQYDRLRNLVAASKFPEYNVHFREFLDSDRAKRDFLLTALSKKYPNIVDNLTTKEDLKFEELKDKLFSLHTGPAGNNSAVSNDPQSEKAMVTGQRKPRGTLFLVAMEIFNGNLHSNQNIP